MSFPTLGVEGKFLKYVERRDCPSKMKVIEGNLLCTTLFHNDFDENA